jgi:peptidoglycan hydrolase CwlO-like protein
MRSLIVWVFLLLAGFLNAFGQTIMVKDTVAKIGGKNAPAFSISSEAEARPLLRAFKKELRSKHKLKTRSSRSTITVNEASIAAVGEMKFDLNILFTVTAQGSIMIVSAAPGHNIYLSPEQNPMEYGKLKKFAEDFVKEYLRVYFSGLIAEKEKVIKNSQRDEMALIRETKRLEKRLRKDSRTVNKLTKRIEQNTTTVESNKEKLPILKQTIEEKKKVLEEMKAKQSRI